MISIFIICDTLFAFALGKLLVTIWLLFFWLSLCFPVWKDFVSNRKCQKSNMKALLVDFAKQAVPLYGTGHLASAFADGDPQGSRLVFGKREGNMSRWNAGQPIAVH